MTRALLRALLVWGGSLCGAATLAAEPPIFEGWAGRYQSFSRGELPQRGAPIGWQSTTAWHGMAILRSPSFYGFRLGAAAETAPQPGALTARDAATWDGAEITGTATWRGWRAGQWSLEPAVAAGGVVALGEARDRVSVTPLLLAAGARAEWRAGGASIRLYAGVGRHGAVSDAVIGIGDVLVRLPLLGDRVALHARIYTGEAASWRYGLVARWW